MIEREEEIEKKYPNKDKKNADPRGKTVGHNEMFIFHSSLFDHMTA